MINNVVKDKGLYFSYEMDLTQSIYKLLTKSARTTSRNDFTQAEFPNSAEYIPHFAFNHGMLKEF